MDSTHMIRVLTEVSFWNSAEDRNLCRSDCTPVKYCEILQCLIWNYVQLSGIAIVFSHRECRIGPEGMLTINQPKCFRFVSLFCIFWKVWYQKLSKQSQIFLLKK
jgi:hypothetical protein